MYQVRLGWGENGLKQLEHAEIIVIVDALPDASNAPYLNADLVQKAKQLPKHPTVFLASLRNRKVTARAVYEEQLARGTRTAINLVLAGANGDFAVEDYLVAGAVGDSLSELGIDHTAPDLAVAIEGFRSLKSAVKHLFSASASGVSLKKLGRGDEVKAAVELDADDHASRV